MSVLLGLSFDEPSSPEVSFGVSEVEDLIGWGLAWYPALEHAAAVIRDPFAQSAGLSRVLHDFEQFRTCLVVSHLRGAAKRATHRDTHPFVRAMGNRSWTIAHNGDLLGDLGMALPLHDDLRFQPIGSTDTEHLFCWLLREAASAGAPDLATLGFDQLHDLLSTANDLGTMSVLLADGTHLAAYRDQNAYDTLWLTRRTPPHDSTTLASEGITLDWSDAEDSGHTLVAVSSVPLSDDVWTELRPGQLIVVARGGIAYDSLAADRADGSLAARRVPRPPVAVAVDGTRLDRPSRRVIEVVHRTSYRYEQTVERSSHVFRLTPHHLPGQRVVEHGIEISLDGMRYEYEDVFGNTVTGLEVHAPFTEMTVVGRSVVEVDRIIDRLDLLPERHRLPLVWMPWQRQMMQPYLLPMELPESELRTLSSFASSFAERNRHDLSDTLDDLNRTIHRDFTYKTGFTSLETTPYQVYESRAGVCQDFANLFICVAQLLDVPARYRVGYIYTAADYANTLQSEASHAWAEVYLPHIGWRGYDPTNGCRAGADHVRVACGRNYRDATPTSGVIHRGGGGEHLDIDVRATAPVGTAPVGTSPVGTTPVGTA